MNHWHQQHPPTLLLSGKKCSFLMGLFLSHQNSYICTNSLKNDAPLLTGMNVRAQNGPNQSSMDHKDSQEYTFFLLCSILGHINGIKRFRTLYFSIWYCSKWGEDIFWQEQFKCKTTQFLISRKTRPTIPRHNSCFSGHLSKLPA